jgi:nifR3 family TIM-barrel protein
MVSAKALCYQDKKTVPLMELAPGEHPAAVQLFGSDPVCMQEAAAKAAELANPDIIDINMGCPVPKIVKNNEGSALMRDIPRAAAIIKAVKAVTKKPVTVKIRAGFSAGEINAVEMALALEEAGADAVAVHGRTREQYYSGKADWGIIRRVKDAVKIPVIGNGDVTSPARAAAIMEETGCDYVMIARAAQGNPWLFRDCLSFYENGTIPERPSKEEVVSLMLRHARMQLALKGDRLGILEMRKHVAWYTQGFENSSRLRARINEVMSFDEMKEVLDGWLSS